MNRTFYESLRVELHRRVDEAIDAAIAALRLPRRQVLPPQENKPVDEIAQARARKALKRYGINPDGD